MCHQSVVFKNKNQKLCMKPTHLVFNEILYLASSEMVKFLSLVVHPVFFDEGFPFV